MPKIQHGPSQPGHKSIMALKPVRPPDGLKFGPVLSVRCHHWSVRRIMPKGLWLVLRKDNCVM